MGSPKYIVGKSEGDEAMAKILANNDARGKASEELCGEPGAIVSGAGDAFFTEKSIKKCEQGDKSEFCTVKFNKLKEITGGAVPNGNQLWVLFQVDDITCSDGKRPIGSNNPWQPQVKTPGQPANKLTDEKIKQVTEHIYKMIDQKLMESLTAKVKETLKPYIAKMAKEGKEPDYIVKKTNEYMTNILKSNKVLEEVDQGLLVKVAEIRKDLDRVIGLMADMLKEGSEVKDIVVAINSLMVILIQARKNEKMREDDTKIENELESELNGR